MRRMETLAELKARSPRPIQIFFERRSLRGGPFREVDDPAGLLVLAGGAATGGRTLSPAEPRGGQLTLRAGVIKDAALRDLLRTATFCGTPEYLDLWVVVDQATVGRWRLEDARIVEVADRRSRRADDESYALLTVSGRLRALKIDR